MSQDIGDNHSTLFRGLSGFWQKFFKDAPDIEAYYQAAEVYLGQAYLDLLSAILNIGIVDTPIFNKEYWKLFAIKETEVNFKQGIISADNRYVYDMPGDIVNTDYLQSTIFEPDVLLEKDVDFEVEDNDGLIQFYADPFRAYQDESGAWLPSPGVAWRSLRVEVGNQFTDQDKTGTWEDDWGVRRGDTLRILAQTGTFLREGISGQPTEGQIVYVGPGQWVFNGTDVGNCQVGDIIQVYNTAAPEEEFDGFYVVKSTSPPGQVMLEATAFIPAATSTVGLNWKQFHATYFDDTYQDYEIDYFEGGQMVGPADNPYPLNLTSSLVYAVVRDAADPQILGASVLFSSTWPNPWLTTDLGFKHIVRGSVVVHATVSGQPVEEGVDYAVDYFRGRISQLTYWDASSVGTCNYQYQDEVLFAAGGIPSEKTIGTVKQVSYWVPEVLVDRFTLWYNYGSLLNRFDSSSEPYRAFLRGVMHLYMMGPILERIEAALNVAAEYPVVKNAGEILQAYDNGMVASGNDGTIDGVASSFNSPSYTFTTQDVGGYVIFPDPLSDINKGRFLVVDLIDEHTVQLQSEYGFASETPVDWEISHTYQKVVTTDQRSYAYPYYVPIREDIQESGNFGTLVFDAFEPLTLAFNVTDYIEDPHWWHNKSIPKILWDIEPNRRLATTLLYENVIGPDDDAKIGDPGFFIGADDEGYAFTPNDNSGGPGVGLPVNLYRHQAAFILFDRYVKLHMFFVEIHQDLELDAQFKEDLEELILVAKPSYTYPYVEKGEAFLDEVGLDDLFDIPGIGFHFGGEDDGESDSLFLAKNELKIGDADFPWAIGDYFMYDNPGATPVPGAPNPVTAGYAFTVPLPNPTDRLFNLVIHATVGGEPILEGRDYTVNWLVNSVNAWEVTALTDWDAVSPLTVTMELAAVDNISVTPTPDTVVGWTPLFIGGLNPFYVRSTALDPDDPDYPTQWSALRTEQIDRAIMLKVNANTGIPGGVPYTYP